MWHKKPNLVQFLEPCQYCQKMSNFPKGNIIYSLEQNINNEKQQHILIDIHQIKLDMENFLPNAYHHFQLFIQDQHVTRVQNPKEPHMLTLQLMILQQDPSIRIALLPVERSHLCVLGVVICMQFLQFYHWMTFVLQNFGG